MGIQFFQIGEEKGAVEALEELDDGLKDANGVRDIVDTVPCKGSYGSGLNADGVLKVVLESVKKRLDRKAGVAGWTAGTGILLQYEQASSFAIP